MARATKYGVRELHKDFPTNKSCLEFIFDSSHSRTCSCGGTYTLLRGRKLFQCSKCRHQVTPMVGTIFEKSSTPLMLWFHAVMVFSNAKSGISAKQMERYLAVTYKCAWRILGQIRSALAQFGERLQGDVETDGAYFGGRKSAGRNNEYLSEAFKAKTLVLGAMQRGGAMRASVVSNMKAVTVTDFIQEYVERSGTRLMTDGSRSYERVAHSYKRQAVDHHRGEYVRGDIHVNSMENFWSHAKRSIVGTHKRISKKHAQSYINAFVFHYNNRYNDRKRFLTLLGVVLHVAKKKETEIES